MTMNDFNLYSEFLLGEWTMDPPKVPGYYPTCAVGCEDFGPGATTTLVVEFQNGKVGPVRPWSGWWWSRPLPSNFGLPLPSATARRSSRPPLPR